MNRLALIATLFTTACVSNIDGTVAPEPPVEPEPQPQPPAPSTDVEVRVRDAGLGVSGVSVVFQAADDTVIAERVTDASGNAIAAMPAGGSVTVIRTAVDANGETRTTAFTYANVEPGDVLQLGNPTARGTAPVTVELQVPIPDPEQGIGVYTVITPCGTATGIAPKISITLDGCGPETDFFVIDQAKAEPGSFLAHRAIAPSIDLSQEVVRENRATTLSATNAPPDFAISLEKRLLASGFEAFTSTPVPVDTATLVPDIGAAVADQLVVAQLAGSTVQTVAARMPYSNDTASIDLGDVALPLVQSATFDGTSVAWTLEGAGVPEIVVATVVDGTVTRQIAAPHAATPSVRLPVLPASYGVVLNPAAPVDLSIARGSGGYAGVRPRVFAGSSLLEAVPMNGRISIANLLGALKQ